MDHAEVELVLSTTGWLIKIMSKVPLSFLKLYQFPHCEMETGTGAPLHCEENINLL